MVAFGDYQEYSLMSSFRVWTYKGLSFDMGGGMCMLTILKPREKVLEIVLLSFWEVFVLRNTIFAIHSEGLAKSER